MTSAQLSQATFRAGSRFELKRLDELTAEQRQAFEELARDADFYGLLIPRSASATVKSVGSEMAALLRSLAVPSRLSPTLDRDEVIDLVLDGVLEIEHDGRFLFGADALPWILDCAGASPIAVNGIARLSMDALRYAEDLQTNDAGELATALYLYNRIPLTRAWNARFPDRDAVLKHLAVADGPVAATIQTNWSILPPEQSNGWIVFQARRRRAQAGGGPVYKLYVSPRPENIRDAFEAVVRTLAGRHLDFKIGPDAAGLLRPDKLVVYFAAREELALVAEELRERLAGCAAHGVPFTSAIDLDCMLSWGIDPPDSQRALSWVERESWRLWLATKLGTAIAFARSESPHAGVAPSLFAIERVRRLGVDVDRWTPAETLWRET